MSRPLRALLGVALLAGCAAGPAPAPVAAGDEAACAIPPAAGAVAQTTRAGAAGAPEPPSGYRTGLKAATAERFMVAAAHPLAAQAGCRILAAGGSAADAAVAVQAMLGLVEPQSSGIGGGAFIVHHDAARQRVQTWDGRETAPAAALPDDLRWISAEDRRAPQPSARASGRSIGVPGVLRALEALHRQHGRLPWARLFDDTIALADAGFPLPRRLADAIAASREALARDPDAAALFLRPDGVPRAAGEVLRNPAYADTLRRIARDGASALYRGEIAADIVAEVARSDGLTPGRMTLADLAGYRAVERDPVCIALTAWRVCGMAPPSSGGLAVAQVLGILEHVDGAYAPTDARGVPDPAAAHALAEALRLAFADRNAFVADTDFVPLPGRGVASLLDAAYLRQRAALIRPDRSLGVAEPGRFDVQRTASAHEGAGTSQVSVVDAEGDALAMTTSVEGSMGSWRVVRGFVLNNQLTDFASSPSGAAGPVANRLEGGKRPRSSMAPTLVFDRAGREAGELRVVTGSPGGAAIIAYVARNLVGLLHGGLDPQQAAGAVNVVSPNSATTFVGGEHPAVAADDALVRALVARGHKVDSAAQTSGVATIVRVPRAASAGGGFVLQGGVDPRREGLALGR